MTAVLSTFMKLGVAGILFAACCHEKGPSDPSSTVQVVCVSDGGTEEFDADQSPEALGATTPCARACAQLAKLGCPESRKPAGGRTCTETCKEYVPISSYDPECVARAADVVSVRKCPLVKCQP